MKLDAYITKIDIELGEFRTKEDAEKWKEDFNEIVNYVWGEIELLILKLPE